MPCIVKKTLQQIRQSGNHYLVKVKGNQKRLYKTLRKTVTEQRPSDTFEAQEKHRGRIENRTYRVYLCPENVDADWIDIKRVIYCYRSGRRQGKAYQTHSYYISSRELSAADFATGIRGHWYIENKLHWVKDVNFNEDGSLIKTVSAASNLSLLKNIAMNIYRINGYHSMKTATIFFTNKIEILLGFMRT